MRAVDKAELRGLVNVIVFATKGVDGAFADPLPLQIPSLTRHASPPPVDGDTFSLIFDPRLLPRREVAPFDYTAPSAVSTTDVIRPEHLQEYFVEYVKNDNLGSSTCPALIDLEWSDPRANRPPAHSAQSRTRTRPSPTRTASGPSSAASCARSTRLRVRPPPAAPL